MNVKESVIERYTQGAEEVQISLCCPVDYDAGLLKILPEEIIEKDYGCGDPSRYVREGDVVLDLGSGGGKICYMAAQVVGNTGRVIGIDMSDDMLSLAKKYQNEMSEKLGGDRVKFYKGHIQDLALNLKKLENYLSTNPVINIEAMDLLEAWKQKQIKTEPMITDNSVDVVVSNCVLNLVQESEREKMISEIYRVLKPGGRVAISDIVADEIVDENMNNDPELWSGCISGAFHEKAFLDAFEDKGFVGVAYDKWSDEPWQTVEGVEFRSVTIVAHKPLAIDKKDVGQAAIYKGPFQSVAITNGNITLNFPRGERMIVDECTAQMITKGLFGLDFVVVNPAEKKPASSMCCKIDKIRPTFETKGGLQIGAEGSTADNSGGCC